MLAFAAGTSFSSSSHAALTVPAGRLPDHLWRQTISPCRHFDIFGRGSWTVERWSGWWMVTWLTPLFICSCCGSLLLLLCIHCLCYLTSVCVILLHTYLPAIPFLLPSLLLCFDDRTLSQLVCFSLPLGRPSCQPSLLCLCGLVTCSYPPLPWASPLPVIHPKHCGMDPSVVVLLVLFCDFQDLTFHFARCFVGHWLHFLLLPPTVVV